MRRLSFVLLLSPLLILAACATEGPGKACTPCEQVPAVADATGPFASAAAAAAKGGQDASNQPQQQDPARINPNVLASSGSGAASWTKQDTESRSQAGAPSVNQGLVLPTEADARAGGGLSPVVASLQALVDDLRERLRTSPSADVPAILQAINDAHAQMAQAQASTNAQTSNVFHLEGAVITQTVANGSSSGDGQQAVQPENARAIASGVEGALKGAAAVKSAAPAASAESPSPSGPTPVPAPAEEPK